MGRRIVFFGTPDFALTILEALLDSEHTVVGVVTQPDRRSGRGRRKQASPVKQCAEQHGLPVYQPLHLKDDPLHPVLQAADVDLCVVVAYGLIIPASLLAVPPEGFVNVHASLLPAWRGAAPIQRGLMAGDDTTGVTIMRMEAGLDTGPMLSQRSLPITGTDTSASLMTALADVGATALIEVLGEPTWPDGITQNDSEATYAHKIEKAEGHIEWSWPMQKIDRYVRALQPWPVVQVQFRGATWRIWAAIMTEQTHDAAPGRIMSASREGIDVACGEHTVVRIVELQRAGGRRIDAGDFCNSQADLEGDRFSALCIGEL